MTPRIIQPSTRVLIHHARHRYDWAGSPGCGFGFDIVNGRVSVNNPRAWRNYQLCLRDGFKVAGTWAWGKLGDNRPRFTRFEDGRVVPERIVDMGVEEWDQSYREPAVLLCDCGTEVELCSVMYNECPTCHLAYNLSGQKLAPRSQWGEETGESFCDIANYNYDINTPVSQYAEVD